jgi:hypothetical protein
MSPERSNRLHRRRRSADEEVATLGGRLCAARRHRVTVTARPCGSCETERLHAELVARVVTAHPVLSAVDAGGCIDAITGSIRGLSSFLAQLSAHQGGVLMHPTAGFSRLLWALRSAGATDIALPVCTGCGATPRSMRRVGTESLCSTCHADRHRRPCSQCGVVAKVAGVDDDRRALCRRCHALFSRDQRGVECASCRVTTAPRRVLGLTLCHPCEALVRRSPTSVGECSTCLRHSHRIACNDETALCRTCTTVYVVAEITRVEPGIDPGQIEAILAEILTHRGMLGELADHFLDRPDTLTAPDPKMPAIIYRLRNALCDAGATEVRRWTCAGCGASSRHRVGELCLPCHHVHRAEVCSRCGELEPLARRGPGGEAWCGRCAPHAEVLFEVCVQCTTSALPVSRIEEGPLCGRCTRARYVYPNRPCCRCGHDTQVAANWPDGAVCPGCYQVARTEWAWCHTCNEWKITPARDDDHHKLCTECSGLRIDLICPTCGKENGRFTATQCPRCWVHSVLAPVLHDATGRVAPRLEPLHETLTDAMTPAVARHWLEGPSAAIVSRMARNETPITHDALDQLRLPDGRDRLRLLRALLVTAGVLEERNEVIASVESAIKRDLARLDATDGEKACLRHYAHFELLRKLRRTQERHGRSRGRDTAAGKWKAAVTFVGWLTDQGVTLSTCTQGDLDVFLSTSQGQKLAQRIEVFVNWARPRGHVRSLRVSTDRSEPRYDQIPEAQLLRLASELIEREDWDLHPRVAGLLVILFGLTLPTIVALRCSDLIGTADGTELEVRGFATTLPAPVGELAARLAERSRRPGCSSERWLFPGKLANQPISLSGMAKQLARIGFPTILARNAARRRLVSMLDPDVMRRITDISSQTANDLHIYYSRPSLDRMSLSDVLRA